MICDLTKQQKYGDFRNKEGHVGLKRNEHCDSSNTSWDFTTKTHGDSSSKHGLFGKPLDGNPSDENRYLQSYVEFVNEDVVG